jgi:hypothetical protein
MGVRISVVGKSRWAYIPVATTGNTNLGIMYIQEMKTCRLREME